MRNGTRLSGIGKPSKPSKRLKPIKYNLTVTLVAPDQAKIDLWRGDRFVEMVAEVDPADLEETDFDFMGRLKPSVIWGALQTARQYLLETRGIVPVTPSKHKVFQADYFEAGRHPSADD